MRVFLGGTCANSKWREELIPKLNIDYFNPVIKNWTPEYQKEKLKQKETCDFILYTLTKAYSVIAEVAEVIDDSNKRPEKTIVCVTNELMDYKWYTKWVMDEQDIKHLDAVGRLIERNGGLYFKSLDEVAEYLNNINKKENN